MKRLLIINPNTTQSVSDKLDAIAKQVCGLDLQIRTVTASFGAPYIDSEASYAVAAPIVDSVSAAVRLAVKRL